MKIQLSIQLHNPLTQTFKQRTSGISLIQIFPPRESVENLNVKNKLENTIKAQLG